MKAITREEKIMSGENLTPITRKEMFLAKLVGKEMKTPTPITRREMFLSKIGGGSGGEETKYYTVNFYNGDELLQSVSVPQGGNAIYTGDEPVKEGEFAFTGFVPDGTNITVDTDCYAQFVSTKSIARSILDGTITDLSSDAITRVNNGALSYRTKLVNVNLPNATYVNAASFYNCTALESVNIPNVKSIGSSAFSNCSSIKSIHLGAIPPNYSIISFNNINSNCVFYVPKGSLATYQADTGWQSIVSNYSFVEEDR